MSILNASTVFILFIYLLMFLQYFYEKNGIKRKCQVELDLNIPFGHSYYQNNPSFKFTLFHNGMSVE